MTVPLQTLDGSPPPVCTMLRTKTAFGTYSVDNDPAPWQTDASTTAAYWCLKTMDPSGPDDDFAYPGTCVPGRECYRSPVQK